ncbi:MAG: hypothetical protein ACLR8P_02285 [Clostridium fessum]
MGSRIFAGTADKEERKADALSFTSEKSGSDRFGRGGVRGRTQHSDRWTGAGKSIIIGSVQIALGGKAPKEMIRRGCDSAYIELVFSIDDERKREQLKEHDVYPDEEEF